MSRTTPASAPVGFRIENYGNVFFVRCHSQRAKAFLLTFVEPTPSGSGTLLRSNRE